MFSTLNNNDDSNPLLAMDTVTMVDGTERGPLMLNPKLMPGTDATMVAMVVMAIVVMEVTMAVDTTGDKFI